jgi:hypothetical protein
MQLQSLNIPAIMRQSTIVFNSTELEWERPAGMT